MDGETFYQNVFLLTQAVQPSKDFLKHFKEGMFDKPNTVGFQHVTHYLLTIYDSERSKKLLQWPLFCKKSEAKYRTDVKDFLTCVAHENPDADFPQILASHLLHASGSKFNNIMYNLSAVALRTLLKRETETMLFVPKPGVTQDLSRTMLNNLLSKNNEIIEEVNRNTAKNEKEAKEYANETAESIRTSQDELFLSRQSMIELSSEAPVRPDVKQRLNDPNDVEVLSMWRCSIDKIFEFLKVKQNRLREIAELSNSVASIIGSIVSTDKNILDGKRLTLINTKELSEIDELSPETQVTLYRLYENDTPVLENFLSFFNLFLADLRRNIDKQGFPDLSVCESQLSASCEDIESMCKIFQSMHKRIVELTSSLRNSSNREERFTNYIHPSGMDNDLFDSVILKSSPTININWNPESDGNEFRDRLELTPVENVHRALFSRHKRNIDVGAQISKLRPKLLVSRINFDETRSTSASEKLSPVGRSIGSRMIDQWNASRDGKYSGVFSTYSKRAASRLNYSVRSVQSSTGINSMTDMNSTTCDVYNASELRSHLLAKNNKYTDNPEISSTKKFTPTKDNAINRASSTIIETEINAPAIVITDSLENGETAIKLTTGRSPKVRQFRSPKKLEKSQNKRLSISDLVERYKKVCDNSVDVTIRMNFSSENSDEGEKD